jgi:DNA-binding transcriptional MocR family regulator
MQAHYKSQCNAIITALKTHMPVSYMNYNIPTGGMFLWATVKHSNFRNMSSRDLFVELATKGIIAVAGDEFHVPSLQERSDDIVTATKTNEFPSLRLSFAAPTVKTISEGVPRFAAALERQQYV